MTKREQFRVGLHAIYLPYYDRLCEILPQTWQPISGLRTFEEQKNLFSKGRTEVGVIVTKAKPGMSYHNYGLATDWGYFPQPKKWLNIAMNDGRWREYQDACRKVAVRMLAFEMPHNQYNSICTIDELYMAYESNGMKAVDKLLLAEQTKIELKKKGK